MSRTMRSRGVSSYRSNKRGKRGNKLSRRISKRRVKRGGWGCDTERAEIAKLTAEKATLEENLDSANSAWHSENSDFRMLRDSLNDIFNKPVPVKDLKEDEIYVLKREIPMKYLVVRYKGLTYLSGVTAHVYNTIIKGQESGETKTIFKVQSTFYHPNLGTK